MAPLQTQSEPTAIYIGQKARTRHLEARSVRRPSKFARPATRKIIIRALVEDYLLRNNTPLTINSIGGLSPVCEFGEPNTKTELSGSEEYAAEGMGSNGDVAVV